MLPQTPHSIFLYDYQKVIPCFVRCEVEKRHCGSLQNMSGMEKRFHRSTLKKCLSTAPLCPPYGTILLSAGTFLFLRVGVLSLRAKVLFLRDIKNS